MCGPVGGCGLCGISTNTPRSRGSICRSDTRHFQRFAECIGWGHCYRGTGGLHDDQPLSCTTSSFGETWPS
eukprot:symbB.v1.2.003869.t1/scaffold211.1/size373615/10